MSLNINRAVKTAELMVECADKINKLAPLGPSDELTHAKMALAFYETGREVLLAKTLLHFKEEAQASRNNALEEAALEVEKLIDYTRVLCDFIPSSDSEVRLRYAVLGRIDGLLHLARTIRNLKCL